MLILIYLKSSWQKRFLHAPAAGKHTSPDSEAVTMVQVALHKNNISGVHSAHL